MNKSAILHNKIGKMIFDTVKIKDVKIDIGETIRLLRKNNGLSQQELADLLSISRITVQNLEAGKNFTIDTLLKALQHFDLLRNLKNEIAQVKEDIEDAKSLY
ncbi:MAG: transcriptional regulator with XRE-family HTH domain [Saprospiraceae bacterium]